jgi:2-polyprenyl-3-methyl-5-hydroxy-6-metoxy-1,4-benzoquinol methylase
MLDSVLPTNSQIRQTLRYAIRQANFAVGPKLRRNFSEADELKMRDLRDYLLTAYFPSWYSGILDIVKFSESEEGRMALNMHMYVRLGMDRYELVPWLNSVMPLNGARILEIGCGTGSATVALVEQGARVTALDVHEEAVRSAALRCAAHGMSAQLRCDNAAKLSEIFEPGEFDMIFFFAVLEHMTLAEREAALCGAWQLLQSGQYLCVGETPNRLWPYDSHTSHLPFFNWLPDEIALRYAKRSPLPSMRERFRGEDTPEARLRLAREGRGVSFHDFDLALGQGYTIRSD